MPDLFLTLMLAFLFIVFGIAILAIGWLIKGKTRIEKCCKMKEEKDQKSSNEPPVS